MLNQQMRLGAHYFLPQHLQVCSCFLKVFRTKSVHLSRTLNQARIFNVPCYYTRKSIIHIFQMKKQETLTVK